jgi:hypothetical protein
VTFKRILSDEHDSSTLIFHGDGGDTFTIEEVQDCEFIIEHNKKMATEGNGTNQARTMRHIGRIPDVFMLYYIQNIGLEPRRWQMMKRQERKEVWYRMLRDPDYRYFRTGSGAI